MGRKAQKAKKKQAWEGSDESEDEENEETTKNEEEDSSSSEDESEQQKSNKNKSSSSKPAGKKESGSKAVEQQKQQQGGSAPAAAAATTSSQGAAAAASTTGKRQPVIVIYCPISGWPAEMCEYNGNFAKCKQWHIDHAEELKVDADEIDAQGELGRKQRAPGDEVGVSNPKKANQPKEVSIDLRKRTGRKKLCIIKGLEMFNIQPMALANFLKKKFSCGTSVIEPPSQGMPAAVEMQGDKQQELVALLTGKDYNVPADAIVLLREGKPPRMGGGDQNDDDAESSDDEDDEGQGGNNSNQKPTGKKSSAAGSQKPAPKKK